MKEIFDVIEGSIGVVVLPHPDDEVMIAGGIAALHTVVGNKISIVYATNGEASTKGNPDFVTSGQRREEAIASMASLGLGSMSVFLGLPDGALHTRGQRVLLEAAIQNVLRATGTSPATILTLGQFGHDNHRDHIASHEAARRAAQNHGNAQVIGLHSEGAVQIPVRPTDKLQILRHHPSQFGPEPSVGDPELQQYLMPTERYMLYAV